MTPKDRQQLALRIRGRLTERDLSMADIARKAKVTRGTIWYAVYGVTKSERIQAAIAKACGFGSWDDLVEKLSRDDAA